MDRRNFMKIAAAPAPAAALAEAARTNDRRRNRGASLTTKIVRLNLRHTWTTTMSSSTYRDTLHVAYCRDGITGHGEGAPIVRYHENAEAARKAAESVRDLLLSADPMQFAKIMAQVFQRVKGNWAGKAAIDIALMDWVGKKLGIPLYSYFGLDPADAPVTTFSIGIDTPEITRQKTREAAEYPVLKIKVGLATDEPTIEAVRSVTKKPLAGRRQRRLEGQGRGRPQDQLAGEAGRRVHGAAHARRDDRGDALGPQPRAHPDHRRRSLLPGVRHSQAARTPSTA